MALLWVVARQRKMEVEILAPLADLPEEPEADPVVGVKTPKSEAAMDPISEADVFIAYGRYEQAAELRDKINQLEDKTNIESDL